MSDCRSNLNMLLHQTLKVSFRIILCETQQRHLRPLTELPSLDSRMLLELQQSQVFNDGGQRHSHEVSKSVTLLTAHDIQNSTTKQQAQVISLLDQALCIRTSARDNKQRILLELAELDNQIHTFLRAVLNRNWKTQHTPSTIVTLAVR